MIDADVIRGILSQYVKFGWRLHHVLISDRLKNDLGKSVSGVFGDVRVIDSDIDGAWFSRSAENGRLALELRSLGAVPFALVDSAESGASETELEDVFTRTEQEMRERLLTQPRTH